MSKQASKQADQDEEKEFEGLLVEQMTIAAEHAEEIFGSRDCYATEEIHDYLENSDDDDAFIEDLKRIHGHAKVVYKTATPTPEQVFGLFERRYPSDDED